MISLIKSEDFYYKNFSDIMIISTRILLEHKDIQKYLEEKFNISLSFELIEERNVLSFSDKKRMVRLIICDLNTSRYNSRLNIYNLNELIEKQDFLSEIGILFICENKYESFQYIKVLNNIPVVDMKSFTKKENYYLSFLIYPEKINFQFDYTQMVMESFVNTRKMIDLPPDIMNPNFFELYCREISSRNNTKLQIIKGEALKKERLKGVYNVGKGSAYEPRMIILSNGNDSEKGIVLVGEGITFDSGGKSLKAPEEQIGMKSDMAGAAIALNLFDLIVRLYPQTSISVVLCVAENCISRNSMNNDEVIELYSGKTVEITSTDSEGRLVLADGVAYACCNMKKQRIIDIGTLTAKQPYIAGEEFGSIVSNDEDNEKALIEAGKITGDLLVSIPFCPEIFLPKLKSNIADFVNSPKASVKGRTAVAAHFIGANIDLKKKKWMHLDIFGPSMYKGRATGFGFFLLLNYIEKNWK